MSKNILEFKPKVQSTKVNPKLLYSKAISKRIMREMFCGRRFNTIYRVLTTGCAQGIIGGGSKTATTSKKNNGWVDY
jgi:hypothetical protein